MMTGNLNNAFKNNGNGVSRTKISVDHEAFNILNKDGA